MPAWWRGKSKSKSQSQSRSNSASAPRPDKAKSFDAASTNSRDLSPAPGVFGGHPLPRPRMCVSLPALKPDQVTASVSASASAASSGTSSTSSDEPPDFALYRYSEPINMPRGRTATSGKQSPSPISPRCSDASSGIPYTNNSTEMMFNPRVASVSPSPRGQPLTMSPVHTRAFSVIPGSPTRRQEDMRNSPHPLPLPPSSPGSSSSRSLQSQWKKGKLLGRGTFGHVYLGFNSDRGQMCAIKEVKVISDDSNSKESLKQLSQEIQLLSQLSHPNIVQYHGSELDEETLSVYLEYVSGGSIHKLLQEYGPFREPVIRNYTAQILSGLAYLHGRNTVHRDIKGANILVDPNGEIKLADFGMAKHVSSYTSIRSFKGSPYWMAPEVIMNSAGYNLSVDIWSLGCTILEMATSKPPWSQYEGVAAIFKIGNSKDIPDIPNHISSDGKSFLKLCLQRDPSGRPTAAQLMDHPFVRDQAPIKAVKANMNRDVLPSSSDGSHTPITTDQFSSRRSVSPLGDRGMRHTPGLASTISSDLASMRLNISLPVSPCTSPIRQSRPSIRSCLPSPPHPAFSAGAISYSPSNYTLYPMRPSNNYREPWPDIASLRIPSPYDSPRR